MKKIISAAILAILVVCGVALSDYMPDIIVTGTEGLWVDTRAYSSLDAAITAIGSSNKDLYIIREEAVTDLTVPSNINLHFFGSGSINNSGVLSLQTTTIKAANHQIFTGTGEIDFAHGTVLRSSWFADLHTAFDVTNDNYITLVICSGWAANVDADCQVGDNVALKWEGPGQRIVINSGFTLSNIRNIEAGKYQIFGGSGDLDFVDGTRLRLSWFNRLRSVLQWVETENVTIIVDESDIVDYNITATSNEYFDFLSEHGYFDIQAGVTLSLYSPSNIVANPWQQVFHGTGTVLFTSGGNVYPDWWGVDGTDDDVQILAARSSITSGSVRLLPHTYIIDTNSAITWASNIDLIGSGHGSLIYSTGSRATPQIDLDGVNNVLIEGIRFSSNDDTQQYGQVEISGDSTNISIRRSFFGDGYSGVWINPEAGDTIQRILIELCDFNDLSHPLYIGANTGILGETISDLRITENHIRNSKAGGDGIKFIQSVYDCIVNNNIIENNPGDGVDFFASGDRIVFFGNIIKNNGVNGIDIKADLTTYPLATWGSGKQILISSCEIRGNGNSGVSIWKTNSGEWPYLIAVEGCDIISNAFYGITSKGHYVTISDNFLAFNCTSALGNYSAIMISGLAGDYADSTIIDKNHILNNGSLTKTNTGITISSYVRKCTLTNNLIENTADFSNNYQNYGFAIVADTTDILVRNNKSDGNLTADALITTGADIIGEYAAYYIGTIAAGVDDEIPLFTAFNDTCIISASIVNASDIVQDNTNYDNFALIDRGSDGSTSNVIASVNTTIVSGYPLYDFDDRALGNLSNTHKYLSAGDVVSFSKVHQGTGAGTDEMIVNVNYITY